MSSKDFEAFIWNSGGDLYYSLSFSVSHIDYRWGGDSGEGLRKSLVPWADYIVDEKGESDKQIVTEVGPKKKKRKFVTGRKFINRLLLCF